MRATRRNGGLSLSAYLLALLLMPMLAAGFFGYREVQRNDDRADSTAQLASLVELRASASTLRAPLEVERLASMGIALLGSFGIPIEPIVTASGLDFENILDTNGDRLDLARERVRVAAESDAVPESVRTELEASNLGVDRIRERVAAIGSEQLSLEEVDQAFERLDAVLDQLESISNDIAEGVVPSAPSDARVLADLDALSEVSTTAAGEIQAITNALLLSAGTDNSQATAASIRHVDALTEATSVNVAEVDGLIARYEALPWFDTEILASVAEPPFDLEGVREVSQTIMERIAYMNQVADFVFAESEDAVQLLVDSSADAENDSRAALVIVLLVAAATVVVALVVARSIARPLINLRGRAEQISSGELSSEPLPIEGPSDVRKVTSSMNEMAVTLARIDEHMHALATSDVESDPELSGLPGQVGASMRHSMERVAALTRRLRASEARLAEEARIDNLTGLPNRFAVLEHLELRAERARERGEVLDGVGVMFLDVDGFKSVNDTHGHAVGDVVLREIGRRLGAAIRPGDFVARLGGDEFLVVVGDTADTGALYSFGQRLIGAIEQPYEVGDQLFAVSASVGVTIVKSDEDSLAAIERADAAVYQAKRRGRRRVEMFDEELQASIEHQAELELALRQAIQRNELSIHLQPLADLTTGRPSGAEALVRWDRPGLGMLPPDEFIPIAERSGLIFDLERWVMTAACHRLAAWQASGDREPMRLAVNISGRHLIEGDLLAGLDEAIDATGADPSWLTIELTESHLLDDVDRAVSVLSAVRSRGVTIAIDDFGTGYSSMTYLQKLPVDVVKIDRSFVGSATNNAFDATVIESVVTISRALALDVVAEGIETVEQLDYVTAVGCTYGQGYLLARPMPVDQAEAVLFSGRNLTAEVRSVRNDGDGRVPASGGHPRQ